ncbi:peptide chain release factor 1 [Candidatus Sumerlaeota bacterium]|nr:peptide chain release factor 1 [Candidatus Sumerlaeota bacterium]
MIDLKKRINEIKQKHAELERAISQQEVLSSPEKYRKTIKRYQELTDIINKWQEYEELQKRYEETKSLCDSEDEELATLAQEELATLKHQIERLQQELQLMLLPRDPYADKNIIMEIRAGTGGEEAALFAADLYRMYLKFAERKQWRTNLISANETSLGGFKEVIFSIAGNDVFSHLKYESGTHRVQRVPETEASGRIHTSAATVAVMPEADEVDVEIRPEDIRVDVFRASGHGGQHVNVTDSAVRITHLPTGLVVSCQDERSQIKNRAKALKVLRARLLNLKRMEQEAQISEERRKQVGTGDRSERIRTYNFPQNRVTDHRIGLTLYKLDKILEGELDEIIEALMADEQARKLQEL